ncbi:MAG: fibronectin type III domain-containing protein [Eubacterium sp.]|nr:fibronectin type III domain-containing protein [Eubacterium sp.]
MKKKITAIIIVCSLLLTILPLQAFAAGNEEDDLILETSGNTLIVKLKLPNAKYDLLSSVQLSLSLDTGAFSDFQFDQQVTGRAKVYEAYYDQNRSQTNLYIAGTEALFTGDTLTVGSIQVKADGSLALAGIVQCKDVKVVRGTSVEDLNLSNLVEISFGENGSQGVYNPGLPAPGGQQPQEPKDPEFPLVDPDEPETPVEEPAAGQEIFMPGLLKVQNTASGVTIKWSESSNAVGYYVYRKTASGRWRRIAEVTGRTKVSYTDQSVKSKNGKTYTYTVKAYNGKKASAYDKEGLKIRRLTAPALSAPASKAAAKMLVTWKQNKQATGYQIQYARSADFKKQKVTKNVKSVKKTSQAFTKLTRKKTYYVRIRCYKKAGAATYYSAWSTVKTVKIK